MSPQDTDIAGIWVAFFSRCLQLLLSRQAVAETKSLRPVALHDSAEYFPLDYGGSPYQWPDGVTEIMPTNSSWAAFQYHAPGLGGFAFVFRREASAEAEYVLRLRALSADTRYTVALCYTYDCEAGRAMAAAQLENFTVRLDQPASSLLLRYTPLAKTAQKTDDLAVWPLPRLVRRAQSGVRCASPRLTLEAKASPPILSRALERYQPLLRRNATADGDLTSLVLTAATSEETLGQATSYAYSLAVPSDGAATLKCPTVFGCLAGLETLAQALHPTGCVPVMTVEDEPQYTWRGIMLDVSSRFAPVQSVLDQIDAMAMVHLNVLHLHLTEGAYRLPTAVLPQLNAGVRHYSRADIAAIVAFARDRGVRVVPEVVRFLLQPLATRIPSRLVADLRGRWTGLAGPRHGLCASTEHHPDRVRPPLLQRVDAGAAVRRSGGQDEGSPDRAPDRGRGHVPGPSPPSGRRRDDRRPGLQRRVHRGELPQLAGGAAAPPAGPGQATDGLERSDHPHGLRGALDNHRRLDR